MSRKSDNPEGTHARNTLLAFDGEVLALLGGTLFQLLVPAAFVVALWRHRDRQGATVQLVPC